MFFLFPLLSVSFRECEQCLAVFHIYSPFFSFFSFLQIFPLWLLLMRVTVSTVTDAGDKQDSLATNNQRMTNLHPPHSPFSRPLFLSGMHIYTPTSPPPFSPSLPLSLNASLLSPIYCTFFMHEGAHVLQVSRPERSEHVCTSVWKLNECGGHQNINVKCVHCSPKEKNMHPRGK